MSSSAHDAKNRDGRSEFSRRIHDIRQTCYGEHGGPTLAEELGLPSRTWQNYEAGVTMPAVVMLKFIQATGVCPGWLLTGDGPKFNQAKPLKVTETTSSMCVSRGESREGNHAR